MQSFIDANLFNIILGNTYKAHARYARSRINGLFSRLAIPKTLIASNFLLHGLGAELKGRISSIFKLDIRPFNSAPKKYWNVPALCHRVPFKPWTLGNPVYRIYLRRMPQRGAAESQGWRCIRANALPCLRHCLLSKITYVHLAYFDFTHKTGITECSYARRTQHIHLSHTAEVISLDGLSLAKKN